MLRNQPIGKMTSHYDIVLFDQVSQSTASAFEAVRE
jgi:hypothetical protein